MNAATTSQEAVDAMLRRAAPRQGCWRDDDYLWLAARCGGLVEFTDGRVEELPMPTEMHQLVLRFLDRLFTAHIEPRGGIVLFAAFPLRIREGKFREPDLLAILDDSDPRRANTHWTGADLVVEVVSPDNPARDYIEKRTDYAEAAIPEYWIADPRSETITVLALRADAYTEHGVFRRGDTATSSLLEGFALDVAAAFDHRRRG